MISQDRRASSLGKRKAISPPIGPGLKSVAYSITSQDSVDERADALLSGDGHLIPAALLHDDGTLYLEQFDPVKLQDNRKSAEVESGLSVRILTNFLSCGYQSVFV